MKIEIRTTIFIFLHSTVDGKVQLAVVRLNVLRYPGEAFFLGHVTLHGLDPLEAPEAVRVVRVPASRHHLDISPGTQTPGKLQPYASTSALDKGDGHEIY